MFLVIFKCWEYCFTNITFVIFFPFFLNNFSLFASFHLRARIKLWWCKPKGNNVKWKVVIWNNANITYVFVQSNRNRQLISTNNLNLWLFINDYDVIEQGELIFEMFCLHKSNSKYRNVYVMKNWYVTQWILNLSHVYNGLWMNKIYNTNGIVMFITMRNTKKIISYARDIDIVRQFPRAIFS